MPRIATLALALASLLAASRSHAQSGLTGAEARLADLRAFRAEFMARDRSYSPGHRAEAETRLARLEADAATVGAVYFELELGRIVALADNGHTAYFPGLRSRRYNRVPIRLTPLGEEFFVLHAATAHADLLGARLTGIDGRPVESVVAVARTLTGGTAPWRDRGVPFFLESPEQLQALGAATAADAAAYRFMLPGGRTIERRITAQPPSADRDRVGPGRWLYPEPLEGQASGWQSLLVPERAVWAHREAGRPFRWRAAPELEGLVIELRQNNDAPGQPIRTFLQEMRGEIERSAPKNLVLDLRMSGGGDLNTTRDFLQSLPTLIPGRIFVLTSPWTFSAAISSTGYLKQASPDRVTIVGEMAGDRLEFWAEGRVVTLPNSGALILYATERHDYKNGCRDFTDCHGPVVRNPISVPSLAPEIAAPWTLESYRAGRDPAMEAVAAALRRAA